MKTKDKRTLILVATYLVVALLAYNTPKFFPALQNTGANIGQTPVQGINVARAILDDCNAVRAKAGLPTLVWEDHLAQAATAHSEEMVAKNYFEHDSPVVTTKTVVERVDLTGISPDAVGECLYESEGYRPDEVPNACVQGWFHSPVHKDILMDPQYTRGGVGVAQKGDLYRVTMVFSDGAP